MNALQGLALSAFVARRQERARRLFQAARSRAGGGGVDATVWPNPVHRVLAGIVEEALLGDGAPEAPILLLAIERVGALLQQLPDGPTHRDHATRRTVERVGFELARLAGRSDLMLGFGPPMTVAEAAWKILADPDFVAEAPEDVSEALAADAEAASGGASSVTMDHLVAAAQAHRSSMRFSYPPYVFAGLDQQAQVRFSSPSLFRAFDARLAHTGLQTTKRTSFTLRPSVQVADVVDPIMNALGGRLPEVRFEFASHDDGGVQVAAFREVMVGRAMDGIELMLDYDRKAFRTDQRPEEVWRALTSSSPVTVAVVL